MITSVNYRPKFYSSGYNPIIWSVTSDKANDTTLFDYAYVFDLYIDGVGPINRIVQRPNPSFAGMIDVSSFVQPYLNIGAFANETGTPISTPYKTASEGLANIQILVGEQYRTSQNGALTLYTGTANTAGNPAYVLGAQGYTQLPVVVLPASLSWSEQQKTMQAQNVNSTDYYGLFGELAPYILKNDSILAANTCGGVGLFLSKAPRVTLGGNWRTSTAAPSSNIVANDYTYDRHTVTFINRNPVYQYGNSGTVQASSPNVALYTFYDAAGSQITTRWASNSQEYGGAPRTTCGTNISTFSQSNNQEMVSLRVGPKDLEERGIWTSIGEVPAYYTVQLFANASIPSCTSDTIPTPTTPVSELITINVTEDCTSYLYPRVRLSWLNNLGSRDYWNFTMFAEQTINTESKEYYKPEMNWSGTTPVQTSNDTTQNWLKGGLKLYNKTQKDTWTIQSDWLTQEEVEFIKGVVASSQVWAYVGEDDFPYVAKIKEASYTVKTIKMVKVYNVTFNVEFSTVQSMQNI